MQCLKCKYEFELKEGTKFCPQCGEMIEKNWKKIGKKYCAKHAENR